MSETAETSRKTKQDLVANDTALKLTGMIHTPRQAVEALIASVMLVVALVGGFGLYSTVLSGSSLDWLWAGIGMAGMPFLIGGSLYWFREIAD